MAVKARKLKTKMKECVASSERVEANASVMTEITIRNVCDCNMWTHIYLLLEVKNSKKVCKKAVEKQLSIEMTVPKEKHTTKAITKGSKKQ